MLKRLWSDETGAIISSEFVLVATILVIGVIVGLKSVRDSVVTELGDVAQAIANINQSYSYSGTRGHHAFTAGSVFLDQVDFCDRGDADNDRCNSKCIVICSENATPEGFHDDENGGPGPT